MSCRGCLYDGCEMCPENPREPDGVPCASCGEPILAGDRYWKLAGGAYCDECVTHMLPSELLEILELEPETMTDDAAARHRSA